jgi:hypothetical protein
MNKINKKKLVLKEFELVDPIEWGKEKAEEKIKEKAEEKFKEKAEEYVFTDERAKKLKDIFSGSGKEDKTSDSGATEQKPSASSESGGVLEDVTGKLRSVLEPSGKKKYAFSGGSSKGLEQAPDYESDDASVTGGGEATSPRRKWSMSGAGSPARTYENPDSPESEAKEKGSSSGSSGGCSLTPRYSKQCPDNNLSLRCGGENVKLAQQKLMSKGISLPKYKDDCKYGNETTNGVKKFQKNNGLPVTGIIDQATHDKLFAANENKILNQFKIVENRYNNIEKLVFERLVKGCK